jgi:hypothetical protein
MGRTYFGLISSGRIPRFVTDELPFLTLCCNFEGYMPRFADCGCCVYERDELNQYLLRTECANKGKHDIIVRDTSFAQWSCTRSSIDEIHNKIRIIEKDIPIKSYVYLDEDHEIKFRNQDDLDNLSYETNYKIFEWIFLMELLLAFNHYRLQDTLTFTSECI